MVKRGETEGIYGGFELVEVIQRIQSLLPAAEAARTTTVSKAWHAAWSTRPELDLNQFHFRRSGVFANKAIRRYEESNLNISSFSLCFDAGPSPASFAHELIVRAIKIGAKNLNFRVDADGVVLPREVFYSEKLFGLSLSRCAVIDQNVRCSKLESLSLHSVSIHLDMVYNIILSCPSIESLSLSCILLIEKEDTKLEYAAINRFPSMLNLKRLCLSNIPRINTLLVGDFLSKFPFLKDLSLGLSACGNDLRLISSASLECLTCVCESHWGRFSAEFDFPSIRKFTYRGHGIPWVTFKSTSEKWESHMDISARGDHFDLYWFHELDRFLNELGRSAVYLSFSVPCTSRFHCNVQGFKAFRKHEVEHLTLKIKGAKKKSGWGILLDSLFPLCRPKFITQILFPSSDFNENSNDLLWKALVKELNAEQSDQLEEVNMQIPDEDVPVWRPLPLKSFDNDLMDPETRRQIVYRLKWKS